MIELGPRVQLRASFSGASITIVKWKGPISNLQVGCHWIDHDLILNTCCRWGVQRFERQGGEQCDEGVLQVNILKSFFYGWLNLILLRTGFVWEQYNDRTGEGQVRRNLAVKFMILENTYLNDQQNLTFLFRVASLLLGGLRWLYLWWERHTEDCLARKRTSDSDICAIYWEM